MARTESKSMQVHPAEEQKLIELMQKFHWSLLSSQEVKTKDSHLEQNWSGDKIMSVTETEHYIKLVFSRDLDLRNLQEIKKIENKFFSLSTPEYPKLFPVSIWMWAIGALVYGIGIIGWLIYFFVSYKPKKDMADKTQEDLVRNRAKLLEEAEKYN
ncbi:MAG: hypothetical protein L6290_00395 [Thermodesulfovibrionales bacterium]|nr:hypothetical protein [Thermodesulfovibrionales bacterium]